MALSEAQLVSLENALGALLPEDDADPVQRCARPTPASACTRKSCDVVVVPSCAQVTRSQEIDAALEASDVSDSESCVDAASPPRPSLPKKRTVPVVVLAQPLSSCGESSSEGEAPPAPPPAKPPPTKKRSPRSKSAAKKSPRIDNAKSRPGTPRELDCADASIARVLASGPKPEAQGDWDIAKDAHLARLNIADRAGIVKRLMEVDPSLPATTALQYQRGYVAMFGFKTRAYDDLASLCAWYKAFDPPNLRERTKQQAVADFIAAHYFPALGGRKLDVNGTTHRGYAAWAEGIERCLDDFLHA